jgi:hypothetical protein
MIKYIKNKEESNIKKSIEEIGQFQKEFIIYHSLIEKLISIRKESLSKENNKFNIEGLNEKEKKEFFDELSHRKENLKKYNSNIIELEKISNNIRESMEMIFLSNCIINN